MSLDIERAIVACLIMDSNSFLAIGGITMADFRNPFCRDCFKLLTTMFAAGKPIDQLTVTQALKAENSKWTSADVLDIFNFLPSASNVAYYVGLLKRESSKAKLMAIRDKIDAKIELSEPSEIAKEIDEDLSAIQDGHVEVKDVVDVTKSTLDRFTKESVFMRTGFKGLDLRIGGYEPGTLIVIAGRPSMGKTSFAVNTFFHIALKENLPALYFTLETSAESVMAKLYSSYLSIDGSLLKGNKLNGEHWDKINRLSDKLITQRKLWISDLFGVSVVSMKSVIKQLIPKGLKIVFVDYLQLMIATTKAENREKELSSITRALKGIAMEFHIPVIAISQLSREVEKRSDKRPILADLRDSGAIEQDADVVMFVYREGYYKQNGGKEAEVIIAKNREGVTDTVNLLFEKEYMRFVEPTIMDKLKL